jgi:hypothetical protein
MNNFKPDLEKEYKLKITEQASKNKIINIPNQTKKLRTSEYFCHIVQQIAENPNSRLTHSVIQTNTLKNPRASKINIYGNANKESDYIPEHHRDKIETKEKKIYMEKGVIGKVDEDVINYFNQGRDSKFGLEEIDGMILDKVKQANMTMNLSKCNVDTTRDLNLFREMNEGLVEDKFIEQTQKKVINKLSYSYYLQQTKVKGKNQDAGEGEIKLGEGEVEKNINNLQSRKTILIPINMHKVENLKFAQTDLLDNWI